jgi:hypothetical protein
MCGRAPAPAWSQIPLEIDANAKQMQLEHDRYVHRRPKRWGHIAAIFGEVEYTADPEPFFLSTTVRRSRSDKARVFAD